MTTIIAAIKSRLSLPEPFAGLSFCLLARHADIVQKPVVEFQQSLPLATPLP
ncbi:MAG TPA: hypothetical protein VGF53_11175 [Pseudolabrys sp.]